MWGGRLFLFERKVRLTNSKDTRHKLFSRQQLFVKGGVISLVGAVRLFLDRQTGNKGQTAWWESFQIEYRESYFYFYHTDCYTFEVLPLVLRAGGHCLLYRPGCVQLEGECMCREKEG